MSDTRYRRWVLTGVAFLIMSLIMVQLAPAATPRVEVELIPSSRAPITAAHDWTRTFSRLKAVQVRAGRFRAARPRIDRSNDSVRITAVINAENELLVPGRRFTLQEAAAIEAWIQQQRTGPEARGTPRRDRFGLSRQELIRVHEALKPAVAEPTLGKNARSVVLAITKQIPLDTSMSPAVRKILAQAPVELELQGISCGTALAAVLHPLELVVVPSQSSPPQLVITAQGSVPEAWPIGWKPGQPVREAVPKLFDFLEIEIDKTPVADVLAALEPRLDTPILYDHAALEVQDIDPESKTVSIPPTRTFYNKLLRQALFQARLDFEVRVDERGKPFLWVTPLIKK